MAGVRNRRRALPWIVAGAVLIVLLVPISIVVVPILTHVNQGSAGQDPVEDFPLEVSATGDDGRTRELQVHAVQPGETVDTSALTPGDRLVVSGTGYDASRGIYVAICVIPDAPTEKPGPCVGGVPAQEESEVAEGTVQFAPSNWINDDWAWRLFGARSYDDVATGTFTAYLEVGEASGEGFDCRVDRCAIYTRNDHTALSDRVQDVYLPVAFAE
ncbi:hypothetical protein M2152_002719 [Microbacteriaceae bacterium SG_E_30_P1]|uniref:Uncharacterized protein n=1 Tax=Antiquaquibacter oligotrophicus TaxID=2880260 RepID=A0ABT6KTL5_9MICO|nr:hypothetical protein [Antiquaquibacter oligotrophicus]MDH6182537.1 hypothetical protein [Antiquaquibacter oligotrophicus]UDF14494.1 hypothetical protein LH407_06435 [Antiquaquibacter oligotrophicus]